MSKEIPKTTDYNTSCRICLRTPGTRQLIHLFKPKDDRIPASIVSEIANVEIFPGDTLPQQLCNQCWKKVHTSFLLIQEIQESEKWLRNHIFGISSNLIKTELLEDSFEAKPEIIFTENVTVVDDRQKNVKLQTNTIQFKQEESLEIEKDNIALNDEPVPEIPEEKPKTDKTKVKKISNDPKCCMCRFICKTKEELESHVKDNHPDPKNKSINTYKAIKCNYCCKGFRNARSYGDHFRKPYINRNNLCVQCGQTFTYSSDLMHHELTHNAIKDVICQVCKKSFRSPKNLRRHMKVHDDKNKLQCDLCSGLFAEKKQLEYHIKSHINIRDCLCSVCGKGFVHNSLLKLHMRKHTGERPHICQICGKAYKHNTDLRRHKYEHEGIKPFKCSYCDRTFYQRSNMKVHERVHTGDMPFSCSLCGQKFKFHAHWKSHEKKHQQQGLPGGIMHWLG